MMSVTLMSSQPISYLSVVDVAAVCDTIDGTDSVSNTSLVNQSPPGSAGEDTTVWRVQLQVSSRTGYQDWVRDMVCRYIVMIQQILMNYLFM